MTMLRIRTLLLAMSVLSIGAPHFLYAQEYKQSKGEAERVTGRWQLLWEESNGQDRNDELDLTQRGSKLSGIVRGHQIVGTLEGNKISFSFEQTASEQIRFSGTVDKSEMSGLSSGGHAWSASRGARGAARPPSVKSIVGTVTVV